MYVVVKMLPICNLVYKLPSRLGKSSATLQHYNTLPWFPSTGFHRALFYDNMNMKFPLFPMYYSQGFLDASYGL